MHRSLTIDEATPAKFCHRRQIKRRSLFGSQLKGTAGLGSDIDLLVELELDATPTLFDMVAMEQELSPPRRGSPRMAGYVRADAKPERDKKTSKLV